MLPVAAGIYSSAAVEPTFLSIARLECISKNN